MPVDPRSYDYRRAALDALHFAKLVERFAENLRRAAGYRVQYFGAVEPQHRLAPHAHLAIRGTVPRAILKQVIQATYLQVWWPNLLLVELEVHPRVAMQILRHSQIAVTMDIYSQVASASTREALSKLGSRLELGR